MARHSLLLWPALVLATSACGGDDAGSAGPASRTDVATGSDVDQDSAAPASSGTGGSSARGRERGSRSALIALTAEDYDSAELGALHGEIRFQGEAPERFELTAGDKAECNHFPEIEHLSEGEIVHDGKVQNVFVHLTRGYDEDAIPAPPAEPYMIDQRGCTYTPHVNAVQLGQKVLVRNSDPTTHNVNIRSKKNPPGNKNMAKGQDPFEYDFAYEESSILLKCDIHPWMNARLHVSEHPWFAITGATGTFRIVDVPPGKYTVEAIHEVFGRVRGEIEVVAGQSAGLALTLED
jgi:plastocyanin